MASLTRSDFLGLVRLMRGVYTFKEFLASDESTEAWYMALCSYPAERVRKAIQEWIAHNKQSPTPADIIDLVHQMEQGNIRTDTFSARYRYWVARDRNGTILCDCVAPRDWPVDRVALYFKGCGWDLSGTTLKEEPWRTEDDQTAP